MEYTYTYVSVFWSDVTARGTYVHATDCIFSAGKGRGMVKWAEQPLPGQLSLWANEDRMGQNLLTRGAFGGEASMHDIYTLGQSG